LTRSLEHSASLANAKPGLLWQQITLQFVNSKIQKVLIISRSWAISRSLLKEQLTVLRSAKACRI